MQAITRAERQAAIAVSRDPLVRRAARELASRADSAGLEPDAAVDAQQLLAAAVADALAVLAPDASEIVNDFAMQAALFAEGAHVFMAPPGTNMAEWIASMPDEALGGLRNSMAETARATGQHEVAVKIVNEPKKVLASILAESVPSATSGVITDLEAVVAVADEIEPSDPLGEAARVLSADAASPELRRIRGIVTRQAQSVRSLRKFSFPAVAALLAGLLTRPENHTATSRIEALLHLAALACRGRKKPGPRHLREWLTAIDEDPIAKLEIPVEDVFVSNVDAWFGNARLFEGRWENNADFVAACTDTLLRLVEEHPWAREALGHIMALLRVSEAVAERAGAARYTRTESMPAEKVALRVSTAQESSRHVDFSDDDLAAIGVEPGTLGPFVIENDQAGSLAGQAMGHSALERRPLVRSRGCTTMALPTAVGAAVRRFAIEQAAAAGDLRLFQSTCHLAQFSRTFLVGRPGWGIDYVEMLEPEPGDGMREFIGTFDEGGYVHLVFVPDDFGAIAESGLAGTRPLDAPVCKRIRERAATIAGKQDCRRGLTVLVHGGLGRRFSSTLEDLPDFPRAWHRLCVSAPDFLLLGNMPDFDALRAWKLLQQVDELKARGILFPNLRGFVNLVAYAHAVGFDLVPENMREGAVYLHSDLLLPMRHEIRTAVDRHAARAPDGVSWVGLQRQPEGGRFDEIEGREEFFSPELFAHGEVLACIESASRPWWVHVRDGIPEGGWPRAVVFNVLKTVLGWLTRLAPGFEERYPALPQGPVTFRLRFPEIETFEQRDVDPERTPEPPSVAAVDGGIEIGCGPYYLRSFLKPGNLGDRLMIAAIARGLATLCRSEPLPETAMEEWVRSVAGSENDRFLKMRRSRTPDDLVFNVAVLPGLRLPMPEDLAWSRLNLARLAGYEGAPGPIPSLRAKKLLKAAVDVLWKRVEERLASLSRESTVERALLNLVAARKEHSDWLIAMAPRLALYDPAQVIDLSSERVALREKASLASRVIAEMALCASPSNGGASCTNTDLDFLIAEVWTLVECANQSDAMRYGLAAHPPAMRPNGSFEFDVSVLRVSSPMIDEHWRRKFRDAAEQCEEHEESLTPEFRQAFAAEFGLLPEQFGEFTHRAAMEAADTGAAILKLRKSEVLRRLLDVGAANADQAFEALALCPRDRWDEIRPAKAESRDWYPWRFNRRLSVLRRPLIQLSRTDDPTVIVAPSILANALGYLAMAGVGGRPETLFDSTEMKAFVGRAANRNGHDFTRKVAKRLAELGWQTAKELGLRQFGGAKSLGDVDVLCWLPSSGVVYAIECKSLRFDRTLGEIGERLAEYATGTVEEKRTPLQKHLRRISFFKANRKALADFTGIPERRLRLRSGLVTEGLGSMHFGGDAREMLDVVTDYELLEDQLIDL
ncbi:MAG: hypothetical protein OXQ29_00355 [Rhodospirillaceae bacterium]|nr:hypothetical protein [Rhodospirillaceae bacterium]